MDSLAKKVTRRGVREAMENLPIELNGIYDEAMRRIESQGEEEVDLAKLVLNWISFAFRPLTVAEIRHALAVKPEDTNIDEEALPDGDILISICGGLVTTDQESITPPKNTSTEPVRSGFRTLRRVLQRLVLHTFHLTCSPVATVLASRKWRFDCANTPFLSTPRSTGVIMRVKAQKRQSKN
jgi:hypothetical protein